MCLHLSTAALKRKKIAAKILKKAIAVKNAPVRNKAIFVS